MTRLVKKAAAAKNIPLLALALFAAVFMGSTAYASFSALDEEHWLYDSQNCTDPTEESCYSPASDLDTDCQESEDAVCGINAPRNNLTNQPVITGDLLTDLENGDYESNSNIFRMPYVTP